MSVVDGCRHRRGLFGYSFLSCLAAFVVFWKHLQIKQKLILLQKKVKKFGNTTLDKVYRKKSDFFLKLLQSIGNEKCQIELFCYVNEFGRFSFWSVSQSKLKSNLHTSKWFQVSCIKTLNVFRSLSQIYVSLPKLIKILQNYI